MVWPSSEPSQQDDSDEGSQYMVSMGNKKNYHQVPGTPSYLELYLQAWNSGPHADTVHVQWTLFTKTSFVLENFDIKLNLLLNTY